MKSYDELYKLISENEDDKIAKLSDIVSCEIDTLEKEVEELRESIEAFRQSKRYH